jgi:transcriptional regulator with AAA-type ATPase domain
VGARPETDTETKTATSEREARYDARHPQLVLVTDRARPLTGGARHSLVNIERVTVGRARGQGREATRVVDKGVATLRLLLPDERVSASHAVLERRDGAWSFSDDDSTNGSRINGRDVRTCALQEGDILELGYTFFRFREGTATPPDAPGDLDAASLDGVSKAFGTLLPWLARDLETLSRIARSDVSVLLRGETGTGKEVLARAIHAESGRTGPFVAVNCGALPATLVESLLFGHKRGAFSGAAQDELGLVRTAEGGTLFLDEVGDLGAPAQAALLRVLQEREVLPVGSTRPIATDVRVLAATHRPVEALSSQHAFRPDLLARLSGFTFAVPPLRDRIDDLGVLVSSILVKVAGVRAPSLSLSSELVYAMLRHHWPFNVREVEQRLRTAVVLAADGRIDLSHAWRDAPQGHARVVQAASPAPVPPGQDDELRRDLEAKLTEQAGNVTRVAEVLGKRRTTVQRWIRRLGIDPDRFR